MFYFSVDAKMFNSSEPYWSSMEKAIHYLLERQEGYIADLVAVFNETIVTGLVVGNFITRENVGTSQEIWKVTQTARDTLSFLMDPPENTMRNTSQQREAGEKMLKQTFSVTEEFLTNEEHLQLIGGEEKMNQLKGKVFDGFARIMGIELTGDIGEDEELLDSEFRQDGWALCRQLKNLWLWYQGYWDSEENRIREKDYFYLAFPSSTKKNASFRVAVNDHGFAWWKWHHTENFHRFIPSEES